MVVTFTGELFEYDEGGWHFVSMPVPDSEDLKALSGHQRRGFGSLRVRATIGSTTWTTSVFPSARGAYLLPVKKQVRRDQDLDAGCIVDVSLVLIDL